MTNNWTEAIDLDGDRIVDDAWAYSWVYEAPSTPVSINLQALLPHHN